MYKIRGGDLVSSGHPSSITTHCQDSSSNTVVGDHVFANFNANKQSLSTKGLLSQRNNEHMKFSWDPMQVVNISRQQKAVCNRAQQQYQTLDRYFTRQNHLLAYRRSSVIDQLRQRLATLGKLRLRPGTECLLPARREGVANAAFTIPSTTSSTVYRNDMSVPECTTSTQPEQRNPREPPKSLKYPIHAVSSSQYQEHSDNTGRNTGRVNLNVNTKTRGYALWDYSVEDTPAKSLHLPWI